MAIAASNIIFRSGEGAAEKTFTLQQVLDYLNDRIEEDGKERHAILWANGRYTTLEVENVGQKYIRIIAVGTSQRSVYCFLDYAGNIYKSASWKAPAKHIRGSIFDEKHGWGKALSPYGAAYLAR